MFQLKHLVLTDRAFVFPVELPNMSPEKAFSQLQLVASFRLPSLGLGTGLTTSIAPQNLEELSDFLQNQKGNTR